MRKELQKVKDEIIGGKSANINVCSNECISVLILMVSQTAVCEGSSVCIRINSMSNDHRETLITHGLCKLLMHHTEESMV